MPYTFASRLTVSTAASSSYKFPWVISFASTMN